MLAFYRKHLFFLGIIFLFSVKALTADSFHSNSSPYPGYGSIERLDPALDELLSVDANMEELANGFSWLEGPVWLPTEQALLFSDVPRNTVYKWKDGEGASIFLRPSGFTGEGYIGHGPGANGLMLDGEGQLLLCQHGDKRIARLDRSIHAFDTVADQYEGKSFNSPNDLILDSSGNIYFTDPAYGWSNSVKHDLDFAGVFRVTPEGKVTLLTREIAWPNGIALSPDEKTLYVSSSESGLFYIKAFPLQTDGTLGPAKLLFDSTSFSSAENPGSNDGMCVDQQGNIWTTAPGGIFILTPEGKHLGILHTGQPNGNCTFGGNDGSTLFIMANNQVLRIKTKVKGLGY